MDNILVIIYAIRTLKTVNVDVSHRIVTDIVIGLSLLAMTTASLALVARCLEYVGLMSRETLIDIVLYLTLHSPLLSALLAGLILISYDRAYQWSQPKIVKKSQ